MSRIDPASISISRTDENGFTIYFQAVDDGAGGAAHVVVRASPDEHRWWLMSDLATLALDAEHVDQVVGIPVVADVPAEGETTVFKLQTYRQEADGSKTWLHKSPGEDDGTGDGHVHTWGAWPPPEPEPEPEPEPDPTTDPDTNQGSINGMRVEVWKPHPGLIPTPWGKFGVWIGRQLEDEA